MSDTVATLEDMFFLPNIDFEKVEATIEKYLADHPQKHVGDDSSTHAMMAEFLPDFLERELWYFPWPLVCLDWPVIFWTGLTQKYGLFDEDAPELIVEKTSEVAGIISFYGEEIGCFDVLQGKDAVVVALGGESVKSSDDEPEQARE